MGKKKEVSKFIDEFMEKNNYKLEYIAEMTGASLSAIGHYKTGNRTPKDDFIEKFIESFNLSKNKAEILRMAVAIDRTPDIIKKKFINEKVKESSNIENIIETEFIYIPVYSSVSAGLGCEVCEEPIDFLPFPKTKGEIIGIKVNGDSMEDTILDGAIVIVKKDVMVEIGEIGVFLTTDVDYSEGFVKRLRHKNGTYVLESDNKKYADIEIKTSDIVACGKVIKIMNDPHRREKDPLYNKIDQLAPEKRKLAEALLDTLISTK